MGYGLNLGTISLMVSVSVGTFTKSILIEIAERRGYLTESGITVEEILVPSSPSAFEMLERSEIDVLITSPDNVLAYRYLRQNPLGRKLDARILGAIDHGLGLSLCYAPALDSAPMTFGVDVPTSGFAFVGYELLAQQGIEYGSYSVEALGSTPKRGVALVGSNIDSTILNAGNEIKAISQGSRKIADVSAIGPYIGSVFSTVGAPAKIVVQLQEILNQVITEILSGRHAPLIVEIAKQNLALTDEHAIAHYNIMIDPVHGLVPAGDIDQMSLQTLIDLRNKYLPTNELDEVMADIGALVRTI